MPSNKIMAIDFGTKIIGIAISDISLKFAIPYCEITNDNLSIKKILEIINEENINKIVLGFPKTQNNYVSERHQLILDFKKKLEENLITKIEVELVDESYSTKSTYDSLKSFKISTNKLKKNKDMIAASIILENYLNKLELLCKKKHQH